MTIMGRLKHAWNVFMQIDPRDVFQPVSSYGTRPDRVRSRYTNEKTIYQSILTRMAIDFSAIEIKHVRLDDEKRYESDIDSNLNSCLSLEANVDQAATQFRIDMALSLFEEGVVALVPIDVTLNPAITSSWDILTMRVGRIVQWYPQHIRVNLYNETTGMREEVTVSKRYAAVVENPLYSVMNEPNSTLRRLVSTLGQLDAVGEQSASGKLDLIIQLPYTIKSEARRQQAEQRRKDIEFQLKGSQYGIAYTDGTEKVVQLNRPSENNLLKQVEYLTEMLYSQLGLTTAVMNGTAGASEMQNYYKRTLQPVLQAFVEAMRRSFLTKTARSQGQSIMYFYDPFSIIPIDQIAEIVDKLTRNEVLSSNEFRQILGRKPSKDPKADQLRNSNMPQSELGQNTPQPALPPKQPIKVASQRVPELPS